MSKMGYCNEPLIRNLGNMKEVALDLDAYRPHESTWVSLNELVDNLKTIIGEEEREDIVVGINKVYTYTDGKIAINGGKPIAIQKDAFKQFATRTTLCIPDEDRPRGLPGYLTSSPPVLRALNLLWWNGWLWGNNGIPDEVAPKKAHIDHTPEVMIRTRILNGEPSIFAVMTPSYSVCDCDYVADVALEAGCEEDMKGFGYYNGSQFMIRLLSKSDSYNEWTVGITIKTSDDGDGSIWVDNIAYNSTLGGFSYLPKTIAPSIRKVHRGSHELMEESVSSALERTQQATIEFKRMVTTAATDALDATTPDQVKDLFVYMTANKMKVHGKMTRITPIVSATGVSPLRLAEMLFDQWASNGGGFNRLGVYNAIVCTSNKALLPSMDAREDLEFAAAHVLQPTTQLGAN